jgi:response regulator RpfG family c-di-GMP phosphodiesterase
MAQQQLEKRSGMNRKVLCVDDDANILSGYQRSLRRQFQIETAQGGEAGLGMMEARGPYGVVVADMQMPGMNGVEFLNQVQQRFPDTVRIMLTGNADQKTAVDAVNTGHVFQFMNKPCPAETLATALENGLKQYHLITAEKELLENTLNGAVKVLTDVLSMTDPKSGGVVQKLREYVKAFAESHNIEKPWELELAGMLSQIGYASIPVPVLYKWRGGLNLTYAEKLMVERAPEIGASLIAKIPRLENVARIVLYQNKNFDGSGFPDDSVAAQEIPAGSRILKVLLELIQHEAKGETIASALAAMQSEPQRYDPQVLASISMGFDVFIPQTGAAAEATSLLIHLKDLKVGQTIAQDVESSDGSVIATAGTRVNDMVLVTLNNFARLGGVREPFRIAA